MRNTRLTMMALTAWTAGAVAHAGDLPRKVTVYLRDRVNLHAEVRVPAQALAGRMFGAIGVSLEWLKDKPEGDSSPAPIVIDVVSNTPETLMPGALAYALPYEGAHITVFYDRIQTHYRSDILLAHVMVHEIAHLLEGIKRHSETGIMKAKWTNTDYAGMRMAPLSFAPMDVDLIGSGLSKRSVRPFRTWWLVASR